MSAFIVSNATMNRVVTGIMNDDLCKYRGFLDMATDTPNAGDRIGAALFEMNCRAVDQRYKETNERPAYTYQMAGLSKMEWYKAICCLAYQCAEGDVPNTMLYKALKEVEHRLAEAIISKMTDYVSLPWNWPQDSDNGIISLLTLMPKRQ